MKLVHEDNESYHVQHNDGTSVILKKAGLTPASKALVEGLKPQHFDGGGSASPQPSPNPSQPSSMGVPTNVLKAFKMADGGRVDKTKAHIQDEINNPAYNPPPEPTPAPVEDEGLTMSGPAVNHAEGGDVYNHQTNDRPNPKLGQVPEKDRMPGQIVQHFHFGGSAQPQNFANGSGYIQPTPDNYVQTAPASNSPDGQAMTGGPAPQAPPPVSPTPLSEGIQGEQQELGGIQQQANAKEATSQAAESAYETQGAGLEKAPDIQAAYDELHKKYDDMAGVDPQTGQLRMDPTIDPNHYWGSKSTPNKIASAIGMLFAGAALGIGGHADLAMKAIQDAQNRDIDAQKATFQNKDNLLRNYTQQFNSAILGEQATRLHLAAQTENLINRAAAQNGGAMAQGAAQQAKGQIRASIAPTLPNLALANVQYNLLTNPDAMNKLPLTSKIQYTLPADQQAEAQKQATAYEANKNAHANIDDIFDQLDKEQSTGNLANPQSYSRVKQLLGRLTPAILDASPSKRLTKESIDTELAPFKYGTFADKATRDAARHSVHQIIDNSSDPMNILKDHGLIPQKTYQDKTEPGTPKYKMSGGKKYMRGPNGEAIEVK